MFLSKKDRMILKSIDGAVFENTGFDRHSYMLESNDRNATISRAISMYEIYKRTLLTTTEIAEMFNRHHSNVVRALKNVELWSRRPKTYPRQNEIFKKIHNEIESRIME